MTEVGLAFMLMGYGLLGVFSVLIIFYLVIKLITKVFPEK